MEHGDIRSVKYFIWDFDGTLFDTYPMIIGDFRRALGQFGRDVDPVELMGHFLETVGHAMEYYAKEFDIDLEQLNAAYRQQLAHSNETLPAQPMAKVEQALQAVKARGGENYIFTHRSSVTTQGYLQRFGLEKYFADIVTPQSPCFAWKPAPDGILYLMKTHNLPADQTAMVGDRQIDLDSGIAAGVKTVHYRCKAVPQTLPCDWYFEDFGEMARCLSQAQEETA